MTFEANGFEVVNDAISKETANLLALEFQILRDNAYYNNNVSETNISAFKDTQVDNAFCWYGSFSSDALLLLLQPTIERVVGMALFPTYSYVRIYYKDAKMQLHKDRQSCQYSASITIEVDETGPWELYIENLKGDASALILPVGSMVVYSGNELNHWRNSYTGSKQIQVFLHYVDATGPYKHTIYDNRKMLGQPVNL